MCRSSTHTPRHELSLSPAFARCLAMLTTRPSYTSFTSQPRSLQKEKIAAEEHAAAARSSESAAKDAAAALRTDITSSASDSTALMIAQVSGLVLI